MCVLSPTFTSLVRSQFGARLPKPTRAPSLFIDLLSESVSIITISRVRVSKNIVFRDQVTYFIRMTYVCVLTSLL